MIYWFASQWSAISETSLNIPGNVVKDVTFYKLGF
jgi:hypothetical protein